MAGRWMAGREEMVVANSYVYNHYHDGKEANYFLSTDRINTVAVLPLSKVFLNASQFPCASKETFRSMRDYSIKH